MKIVIDNCVPLNNGDAALIFSVGEKFENENQVIYNTNNFEKVKEKYPETSWSRSLLDRRIYRFIWKVLPFLNKIIFFFPIILKKEYRQSDAIISAPGGYIHSYYGIEFRMYILYLCKKILKKKVGIYSQSIGNLTRSDQKIFIKYATNLDFIFVRDEISYRRVLEYGDLKNVYLTKDAAFLLGKKDLQDKIDKKKRKVAISVRSWDKEGRSKTRYYDLIGTIINICLEKDFEIVFLSTCQGLDDYVDDSKVAEDIIKTLNLKECTSISIDSDYHDLNELQCAIRDFDFVIGTRLHMCILSLLNSVPAFNISYEEKGKATYEYLDIADYSIDYNNENNIAEKLEVFFEIDEFRRETLSKKIKTIIAEQEDFFEIAEQLIIEGK
ncbi:polysaccharide pyruvyl transferase family protein [Candidatus Enterococcus palustris]|nr:polysaccharide pyruvyl transferase family protein [Enterococcus sp. 7F3_DIV0205]